MLVTPEREAAALTFARRNHPELEKLLVRLQKQNSREFEKAVRQLYQASERLARIQERDPERYEIALEIWKLDSRIKLLAARMTMSSDSSLEKKLRELVEERVDARIRQMQLDRSRLASRLEKLDEDLKELQEDRDSAVAKDLQRLKKSLPSGPKDEKTEPPTQPVSAEKTKTQKNAR